MLRRGSKSAKKEAAPAKAAPAKAAKPAKAAPKPKPVGIARPPAKNDIYTLMLGLSFLALLIGCLFLWLEGNRYNWDTKGNNAHWTPSIQAPSSTVNAFLETAYLV